MNKVKYNNDVILTIVIIISTLIGLVDSVYLTWIKLAQQQAACSGFGNCDLVNSSRYAELAGVPIALLGVISYLCIGIFILLENRTPFFKKNGNLMIFGISLIGFLYSIYLTYIEIAILKAICPFCVLSALVMTTLLFATLIRFRLNAMADNY